MAFPQIDEDIVTLYNFYKNCFVLHTRASRHFRRHGASSKFFPIIHQFPRSLTLMWVGGGVILFSSWFSLNNSKTVKAVTLEFCSMQKYFIRDICAKFGIHDSPESPDIVQNSDGSVSDFRISGQSLIKKNCHSSRTSSDIDMKLGPVTKLDKRNKTTSKKFDLDLMSENCDVIVIFWIFG